MDNIFVGTLGALARFAFLPALLIGALALFYRAPTKQTLLLVASVSVVCLGRLVQLFAPFEPTYVKDAAGAVTGATGTFPPMWYFGEVVSSFGFVALAVSFVWFSFTYAGSNGNGS